VPDDTNSFPDVYVRNFRRGRIERVSLGPGGVQADEGSGDPILSADGRLVAFSSTATNLVPGDTNGLRDVLVGRW
jgi:hypothetical protein